MNSRQWLSVWGLNRPATSLEAAGAGWMALHKATVALALPGDQPMLPGTPGARSSDDCHPYPPGRQIHGVRRDGLLEKFDVVSQCLTAALVVHFPRAPTVMWDGVSD
jgi:hypothetical protein